MQTKDECVPKISLTNPLSCGSSEAWRAQWRHCPRSPPDRNHPAGLDVLATALTRHRRRPKHPSPNSSCTTTTAGSGAKEPNHTPPQSETGCLASRWVRTSTAVNTSLHTPVRHWSPACAARHSTDPIALATRGSRRSHRPECTVTASQSIWTGLRTGDVSMSTAPENRQPRTLL